MNFILLKLVFIIVEVGEKVDIFLCTKLSTEIVISL